MKFLDHVPVEEVVIGKAPQKTGPKKKTVLDAIEEAASAAETIEQARVILDSDPAMTLEEMKTVADVEPVLEITGGPDYVNAVSEAMSGALFNHKEESPVAILEEKARPDAFYLTDNIHDLLKKQNEAQAHDIQIYKPNMVIEAAPEPEKWLDEAIGSEVPETSMIVLSEVYPLTLKEIVEIFADPAQPDVCWGSCCDNYMRFEMSNIESIHRDHIVLSSEITVDEKVKIEDGEIFRNREHFLLYALQTCKQKGWK